MLSEAWALSRGAACLRAPASACCLTLGTSGPDSLAFCICVHEGPGPRFSFFWFRFLEEWVCVLLVLGGFSAKLPELGGLHGGLSRPSSSLALGRLRA